MKIQMQGQSLRVRIDESELAHVLAGGSVENLTQVAGKRMRQVVRVGGTEAALLALADGWRLEIPADVLAAYAARLPCRDGLAFPFAFSQGDAVRVVLEVDVRDSARVRGRGRSSGHAGSLHGA